MSYRVKRTSQFIRHMNDLPKRLNISHKDAHEAIHEINEAIRLLRKNGTLPEAYGYNLHELEKELWLAFVEFHALDDVLVIYFDKTAKDVIRLVGIYNHELLEKGKLD